MGQDIKPSPERIAERLLQGKTLEEHPLILFLGSRTGSPFRSSPFWFWLDQLHLANLWELSPIHRFHECQRILNILPPESRELIISYALQYKHTEVADACVAELAKRGIFSMIITTDIGNSLEYAFAQTNMESQQQFKIVHPRSIGKANTDTHFCVFNIFGDFDTREYTVNSQQAYLEKYPHIKALFEKIQDWNMLVVGFDEVWDRHVQPLLFTRRKGELWYVNEEKPKENTFLSLSLQEQANAYIYVSIEGNYDLFFLSLCWSIAHELPKTYQGILDKLVRIDKTLQTMQSRQDTDQQRVLQLLNFIISSRTPDEMRERI